MLRSKVLEAYNDLTPDVFIIENRASGISLIQDLRMAGIPVIEWPDAKWVGKDKLSRVYATTPMFNSGVIWAPKEKMWADDVIMECGAFPAGAHDDYVDTVTQAILWVKGGYFVRNPNDYWNDEEDYGIMKHQRRYYY